MARLQLLRRNSQNRTGQAGFRADALLTSAFRKEMSFEITPMRNRVLPIALLGAAVAVVSLGAIAIPAANAQQMVVVRPARHHHHHRGNWNVPLLQLPWLEPACC